MLILQITIKRGPSDLIKAGIKKEEYREIKPYWIKRFVKSGWPDSIVYKQWNFIRAVNGYNRDSPSIIWEHLGTRIDTGNPEWGAEPGKLYFVLSIGLITSGTRPISGNIS